MAITTMTTKKKRCIDCEIIILHSWHYRCYKCYKKLLKRIHKKSNLVVFNDEVREKPKWKNLKKKK